MCKRQAERSQEMMLYGISNKSSFQNSVKMALRAATRIFVEKIKKDMICSLFSSINTAALF